MIATRRSSNNRPTRWTPIRRWVRSIVQDELQEVARRGREDLVREYGEKYVQEIEAEVRTT